MTSTPAAPAITPATPIRTYGVAIAAPPVLCPDAVADPDPDAVLLLLLPALPCIHVLSNAILKD
jgi:hypothetical protein